MKIIIKVPTDQGSLDNNIKSVVNACIRNNLTIEKLKVDDMDDRLLVRVSGDSLHITYAYQMMWGQAAYEHLLEDKARENTAIAYSMQF